MANEVRPHIGIFGRRNYGKSSLINAIAKQEVAIVSDVPGTTTDPVKKNIEIHGLGPVVFIDTAGIDDKGELGEKRIKKSLQTISTIDLAILVISENNFDEYEKQLIEKFQSYELPFITVHHKSDIELVNNELKNILIGQFGSAEVINVSSKHNIGIDELIHSIKLHLPETAWKRSTLVGDLIKAGDLVLLIVPIDNEAPEGRLILPQVQVIRDILDNDAIAIVVKEREADAFLKNTQIKPKLAITDSSIFLKADAIVPKDIPLTGFSVILARKKGPFDKYLEGTPFISKLKDGDRVLMLESCTHQVSCDDIGRVKIPRWISQFTGKNISFDVVAGLDTLKRPVEDYALIIQCGGCMITSRQLHGRLKEAIDKNIPVTNYGLAIAYLQGVYYRAIEPFVKNTDPYTYI